MTDESESADSALENHALTQNVRVLSRRPLQGGSVSRVERALLSDGSSWVVKLALPSTDPEQFRAEALGLRTLQVRGGPRVPQVLHESTRILVLEDLVPGRPSRDHAERLGRELANIHSVPGPAFGFFTDGFLGATRLSNEWLDDGWAFLTGRRILPLLRLCRDEGKLELEQVKQGERLASRLRDLLPPHRATLVHGDLWNGNVLADASGAPCLIDPCAHFGCAEADISMTFLFGGFEPRFHAAWEEEMLPTPGWRSRVEIHNLVHLLNHLHLFGSEYLDSVSRTLTKFGT
jgi:fructosamine-3-kinase